MASPSQASSKERKIPSPPGYQLGRVLGQGGMGVVYLGKQLSLNRKVAIKVLHPQFTQVVHVKRLLREGRALASLRHNNILSVIDFIQDKGRIYLIMEYIQGVPLSKVIQKLKTVKRPTAAAFKKCCKGGNDWAYPDHHYFDLIRSVFVDLAKGMQHAHEHKILHRDIKPSNIMITPTGKPFLLDFGLSTVANEVTLTSPQEILGTPLYMAPEQIEGEALSPKTDIYSLGATLYQTLGLKTAHNATSQVALLHSVVNKEPTPINKINPHLPRDFTNIVSKSMSKAPEDRYQSMEEMFMDLEELNFDDGTKEPSPVYNPKAQAGILSWIFLILGLGVMGFGFWWFLNQPKKSKQQENVVEEATAPTPEPEAVPVEQNHEINRDAKIVEPTYGIYRGMMFDNSLILENDELGKFPVKLAHVAITPRTRIILNALLDSTLKGKELLAQPVNIDAEEGNFVQIFYNDQNMNIGLIGAGLVRCKPGSRVPMRYRSTENLAREHEKGLWSPDIEKDEFKLRILKNLQEKLR